MENNGVQDSLEEVLTTLREEIYKFVHFTCTGSVSEKPQVSQEKNKQSSL